ncbi:methyltransferase [Glonium stellatum]|uniref:Methyltransferase n=1 Tax=Glonium stellatum TaxID=574774 RepID=A0A8E2JLD6_9PEZI|nr:methyltransferase [Glonium stellatum]
MLPTPSTSHVSFNNVYEPAEDSFLLLDTLSSSTESNFLRTRFSNSHTGQNESTEHNLGAPLILEVGTGSGVVLAFATANAIAIFGRSDLLTLGTDINSFACQASTKTVQTAITEPLAHLGHGKFLDIVNADLTTPIRSGSVDVLIFNPPYVPTSELPDLTLHDTFNTISLETSSTTFEQDSHLLALSYAGGVDGMEITNRLLEQLRGILHPERGVAYILLCAQNKPNEVKERIKNWGQPWAVETVGYSGKKGGWERLQILRIWSACSIR